MELAKATVECKNWSGNLEFFNREEIGIGRLFNHTHMRVVL